MKKNKVWISILLLSLVGIGLACYLFFNFLEKPFVESCYITSTINCDAITKGPLATIFGIPVSLVGLLGYVGIFFAAIFHREKIVLGLASFGLIFCLYIAYRELFVLRVICPVCLACLVVMITVFILAVLLQKKKSS